MAGEAQGRELELERLLPAEAEAGAEESHKTILGTTVVDDDADWHFVMVWCRPSCNDEVVPNAAEALAAIFTPRVLEDWCLEDAAFFDRVQDHPISKVEFLDAVWRKAKDIMTSEFCGFQIGWKPALGGDQVLLMIKLCNPETAVQLADRLRLNVPLTPKSYQLKGLQCPRTAASWGQKLGLDKTPPTEAPAYLPFAISQNEGFKSRAADRLRKAHASIEDLVKDWSRDSIHHKQNLRRQLRLGDVRAATMVTMVSKMKEAERVREFTRLHTLTAIFTDMNVVLEEKDPDQAWKMRSLASDEARFAARLARWSPPSFVSVEEYRTTGLYADFTELDLMRLIRYRLAQFMNLPGMEKHGVIESFFPVHHVRGVQRLSAQWASLKPSGLLQWPGDQHNEVVRDYFGEEVAFFFHWLTYKTRSLILPGLLSVVCFCSPLFLSDDGVRTLRDAYAVFMCAWVAYLTASYAQATTTSNLLWGMLGYSDEALARAAYRPELRGSLLESLFRWSHWGLAVGFVVQTVVMASHVTAFRIYALGHLGEQMQLPLGLALTYGSADKLAMYFITANIKVMNFAWGLMSPWLAEKENWRTDQRLKNEQAKKGFLVKFVVYYYPFFYLAFIRDFVEGCEAQECIHELRTNLTVYIVTHIVMVIAQILVQVVVTFWSEFSLRKKVSATASAVKYTYVQEQAIRPPYAGDTEDYMELIISLGFVTMFSGVYPFVAFLALVSDMIELRVLAFRMCRVLRRPMPRGQEGIGAWMQIMQVVTYVSCVTTVAIVVFTLRPLKEMPEARKTIYFVIGEHLMLALAFLFTRSIAPKSVADELILEHNEEATALILAGDAVAINARSGSEDGCQSLSPAPPIGRSWL